MTVVRSRIAKPADRDKWLAVRAPYYNASAAAVLHDRHPFVTVGDYATEKITGEDSFVDTEATRRGRHLEDGIARWWAEDHGYDVYEPGELFIAGRLMATLDRIVVQTGRPLEVKTFGGYTDDPFDYWLDQCQAQALCADAEFVELAWLDSSLGLRYMTVDADPDFQADLLERAERFMAAIDFKIIPDWVYPTLTSANIDKLFADVGKDDPVDIGEAGYIAMERFRELKARVKDDEEELAAIKDDVARMLGQHSAGTYQGETLVTWNRNKASTKLDLEALIAEIDPVLVAKHEHTKAGSRVFRPKAPTT